MASDPSYARCRYDDCSVHWIPRKAQGIFATPPRQAASPMKKALTICLLVAGALCCSGCKPSPNAMAKFTIHAVTDDGKTLITFPCAAGCFAANTHNPSENTANIDGITDANGNVTMTLPCLIGEVTVGSKYGTSGFYRSNYKYQFRTNSGGKWQPWNPTIEVVVKPILNPIAMYARAFGQGPDPDIPKLNTPIGFDLEAADFVTPYGKGTSSDFIFTLNNQGSTNTTQKPAESMLTISFPNKGDGIQSVIGPSRNQGSSLRLSRFAPESGYDSTLDKKYSEVWVHGLLQENQNYFFRVRTVLDENGKVKSALYGKTSGPIQFWDNGGLVFTYYLNPTPNDRNMEFDPKKNLFKDLPMLQQVNAP